MTKCPTINSTAFDWNNTAKTFNYQILADRFVLNLKKWKNSRCHLSYWYSTVGHDVRRNCQAPWYVSHTEYDPWWCFLTSKCHRNTTTPSTDNVHSWSPYQDLTLRSAFIFCTLSIGQILGHITTKSQSWYQLPSSIWGLGKVFQFFMTKVSNQFEKILDIYSGSNAAAILTLDDILWPIHKTYIYYI